MPKLKTPFEYTGTLGNVSAYTIRGVPGVILRGKGGPSRSAYEKSPKLVRMRENSQEFGGRSRAAKFLMRALFYIKPFADHNIAGPLNALAWRIQKKTSGIRGKRGIQISQHANLLDGFSLNRKVIFESIVRVPITWSIDATNARAEVTIPSLTPGVHFHPDSRYGMYRFVISLGAVPDVTYSEEDNEYKPDDFEAMPTFYHTEWCHVSKQTEPMTVEVKRAKDLNRNQPLTWVLGIGIGYGMPNDRGGFDVVKHSGAAKIIGTAAERPVAN